MAKTPHPPRQVTAKGLSAIPEAYRDAYLDYDDSGDFRLSPRVASAIAEGEEEVARLTAELEALKKGTDTKLAAMSKVADDLDINAALTAEMTRHAVPDALRPGLAALLRERNAFEVEEADMDADARVVLARTPDGLLASPAHLVEDFLESDEGAPFRGRGRQALGDSRFSSIIAAMKAKR